MSPGQQAGFPQARPEYKSILGFDIINRALDAFVNGLPHSPSRFLPDALSRTPFPQRSPPPAVVPAQLAVVWSLLLRGGPGGPTPIANAASLPVALSTSDQPSMFVAQLLPPHTRSTWSRLLAAAT